MNSRILVIGESCKDVFYRGDVLYKNGAGRDTIIKCLEFLKFVATNDDNNVIIVIS